MRCMACGSENSTGRQFCTQCGTSFSNRCPKCGAENPALSKFCGGCGASQIETLTPAGPAAASIQEYPARGERRHLTVLFCDLVGSTEIAHQLDPEEWRDIVSDYQRVTSNAIERFDGHVAKFLGDGVMAYFGYPQAHESDAEHAVHAGLAILDAISARNADRKSPQLAARIGIHTGSVVMGVGGGSDADLFGDAPNLASRVQTAADPGSVLNALNWANEAHMLDGFPQLQVYLAKLYARSHAPAAHCRGSRKHQL
jgi:class 3 adenylate cyclase